MAQAMKLRRPATRDHLLSQSRSERIVELYLNPDAWHAHAEAVEELGKAELQASTAPKPAGADKAVREAKAAVDEAKEALDEVTVEVLLRAVGRKRYDALERQHPPTPKQLEDWEEQVTRVDEKYRAFIPRPPHDIDGFTVALLAASAVEPSLTEDDAAQILDEWSPGEGNKLKMAVFQVNNQAELVGLGKARSSNGSNGTPS